MLIQYPSASQLNSQAEIKKKRWNILSYVKFHVRTKTVGAPIKSDYQIDVYKSTMQ